MKFKIYVKAKLDPKKDCFSVEVEALNWDGVEDQMKYFLQDGKFKGHEWSVFSQS